MKIATSVSQIPFKILYQAFIIFLIVATALFLLYFLNFTPLSWALGWLLGSLIGSMNYLFIIFQANRLALGVQHKIKSGASPMYMVSRLGLFALGLLASIFIRVNDIEIFNIFTIFLAYLVISAIIFLTGANFNTIKSKP
jgi:hypothetical protein